MTITKVKKKPNSGTVFFGVGLENVAPVCGVNMSVMQPKK